MKRLWRTAIVACVAFFFTAVFAGSPATAAQVRYQRPVPAAEKATRNSAPRCSLLYLEDAELGGEQVAVYVTPDFCQGTWSASGVIELLDMRTTQGMTYFFFRKDGSYSPPMIGFATPGEDVLILDDLPIEFSFGNASIRAFPTESATVLSATVAGYAEGTFDVRECSASGCVVRERVYLYGLVVLDKGISSLPGTAVMRSDGTLLGMVLGQDAGRTLVVSAGQLSSFLCQLTSYDGCKG